MKRASLGLAGGAWVTGIGSRWAKAATAPEEGRFGVTAFGARGDGKTLDTPAINNAIEAAAAAGGGTVGFPAGNYLCFSIHLKSNAALFLDEGATIIAADTPEGGAAAYAAAEPNSWDKYQDFGHSHFHNSLLWGEGVHMCSGVKDTEVKSVEPKTL